jgi:hypothetical protein
MLAIDCRSAKRVWLNGRVVLDQPPAADPLTRAEVVLKSGWNRILVKVVRSGQGNVRVGFALGDPLGGGEAVPKWIWDRDSKAETVYFRRAVDLPSRPRDAHINIACDNGYELYVNGRLIAQKTRLDTSYWRSGNAYSLPLREGRNVIAVKGTNSGGPGGLLTWGTVMCESGEQISFATDETWQVSRAEFFGWNEVEVKCNWGHPVSLGTMHSSPWGTIRWGVDPTEQAEAPRMPIRDLPGTVYDPDPARTPVVWYRFSMPPGTRVIRLSTVLECKAYVNGEQQPIGKDGAIRLRSPAVLGGVCAIRAIEQAGMRRGAAFTEPIRFECAPGTITLGSWHERGLPTYSGIGVYSRTFDLPAEYGGRRLILDLGTVRGTAEVRINGKPAGVRIWKPYRFDIRDLVREGSNRVEIVVANTLGPHYSAGTSSPFVFPGQEVSGLLGPVTLLEGRTRE